MDVVAGETVSHVALSEAVRVDASDVDLETDSAWVGGFADPATAENVRAVGLAVIVVDVVGEVVD